MCSEQDPLNRLGNDVRHFLAVHDDPEPSTGIPKHLMQRRGTDVPERTVSLLEPRVARALRA